MKVFCYLLLNSERAIYCGITKDCALRYYQHSNSPCFGKKYGSSLVMVEVCSFDSYKQARAFEKSIKSHGVGKWFLKYGRLIASNSRYSSVDCG